LTAPPIDYGLPSNAEDKTTLSEFTIVGKVIKEDGDEWGGGDPTMVLEVEHYYCGCGEWLHNMSQKKNSKNSRVM
jgi:hypothetical protein